MKNIRKFILISIPFIILFPTSHKVEACTIFTISMGDSTFFAGNEDGDRLDEKTAGIKVQPAEDNIPGLVQLGFIKTDDEGKERFSSQIGMNEYGLCFDFNALSGRTWKANLSKLPFPDYVPWEVCADIEEVVTFYDTYSPVEDVIIKSQIHFADSKGGAMIVSIGTQGDIVCTRLNSTTSNFLVSTNFNVAAEPAFCWRFDAASNMLKSIENESSLTFDKVRDILSATHQDSLYLTLFSYIFEPKTHDMYIYYMSDFNQVVKLNLDEELAKGYQLTPLADLFNISQPSTDTSKTSTSAETDPTTQVPIDFSFGFLGLICLVLYTFSKKQHSDS